MTDYHPYHQEHELRCCWDNEPPHGSGRRTCGLNCTCECHATAATFTCSLCKGEFLSFGDDMDGLDEMVRRGFDDPRTNTEPVVIVCHACNEWIIEESIKRGWMDEDGVLTEAGKNVQHGFGHDEG